jgi:translation elongation factor EF-G
MPDPKNPKVMLEPYEEVSIETDLDYLPMIIEKLTNNRKGVLLEAVE